MEEKKTYQSLDDIRHSMVQLDSNINAEEKHIKHLWDELFHTSKPSVIPSPSRKLQNILTTGSGIIDGALLGWKLYRKFKK